MNQRRRLLSGLAIAVVSTVFGALLPPHTPIPGAARTARAQTASTPSTLLAPDTLHSNGAELRWTRYVPASGVVFRGYEVHRSRSATFTPSGATLIAALGDRNATFYRDSTAAASAAFTYKIVANGEVSNAQTVSLPASGQAIKTLQPGPEGSATYLNYSTTAPSCTNYGNAGTTRIGTSSANKYRSTFMFDLRDIPVGSPVSSATLSAFYQAAPAADVGAVNVHRLRRAWVEGPGGSCSGASWYEAQSGVSWSAPGGDTEAAAAYSLPAKTRAATGGWDDFAVTGLVQKWVSADAPNHGFLLKLADEALLAGKELSYFSDDYPTAGLRPKLRVAYTDNSKPVGPSVSIGAPAPGSRIAGGATNPVKISAGASDDGGVANVQFFVDGGLTPIAADTTSPYEASWDSTTVPNGTHTLTAKATDDAGNVATSAGVSVTVDNSPGPSASVSSPASGATVSGASSVTASATAPAGESITKVDFLSDDNIFGTDATAPYSATWNTLDPLATAFDGSHVLTVKAYDSSGDVATSVGRTVIVANATGSRYKASFDLNGPAVDDAIVVPEQVVENKNSGVTVTDPYSPTGTRDLTSAPRDSTTTMTTTASTSPTQKSTEGSLSLDSAELIDTGDTSGGGGGANATCPSTAFCPTVTVTNTSTLSWKGGDLRVWYRWFAPNGTILFEGPANDNFPQTVHPGQSKSLALTVYSPPLPVGAHMAELDLRLDIYDAAKRTWFAEKGNKPIDKPVIVNKTLESALGIERFYQYEGISAGAGMSHLFNVANGNSLLRWSPFFAPGRGLSTMVDLTYNSLEDHSESPVGNNWSLSMSGLARLGSRIDIHPSKSDQISGRSNRYIVVTDGDGTTHRFDGRVSTDGTGTVYWQEPPGVHLYLREYSNTDTARKWAFTRPDRVTYFFNSDGYPTFVRDKNGNEITYRLEAVPPAEDPGGPRMRIVEVIDAGGRSFNLDYYTKAEARKSKVRGNIQRITDHSGSVLDFEYYDDGNLLRVTQRGGTKADGSYLADRSFVVTYTTSNGVDPASTNLLNPDAKTPNQTTRIYSVADPRSNTTKFAYYGPSEGSHLRWKLKSATDRGGGQTSYAYDITNRITTVTGPLSRPYKYSYDTFGRPTSITNPNNETTTLTWSSDHHVTQVVEPGTPARSTQYTYNANGYVTSFTDQEGHTTQTTYEDLSADASDPAGSRDRAPYWKSGRTIPHISQLIKRTNPRGVPTADADDFQWNFTYDERGNVTEVIEPEPEANAISARYKSIYGWNDDGTLSFVRDPNYDPTSANANNHTTRFPTYDANGFPTEIIDGENRTTRLFHDVDGLLRWVQDPRHSSDTGSDERSYKTFFDYDSFHRLGRQSAPKSTVDARGLLIWSAGDYDANDNLVTQGDPQFGRGYPGLGPKSAFTYDAMDRRTSFTNQDGEQTTYAYDAASRMTAVTRPKGVATVNANDFSTLYAYDLLDRVTKTTRHKVDSAGAIIETRNTHYCYDGAGDLVSVTAPKANLATAPCPATGVGFTWRYEYDRAHRTVKSIDPKGNFRTQSYDPNGNVERMSQRYNSTTIDTTQRVYDQRDMLIEVIEPFDRATGRKVTTKMEYDGARNVIKRISPRAFDAAGGRAPFTQFVTSLSYDNVNQLTRIELPTSAADPEKAYVHRAYDPNGNLSWASLPTTIADAAAVDPRAKTEMTYWDPGWLKTSDDPNNPRVQFDYNALGQQSERAVEKRTAPGTIDPDRTMQWTYFPDAMLKTRSDQGGQPSTYKYDAHNNLIEALDAAGVVAPGETAVETQAQYTDFDEVEKVLHRKKSETATANDWTFSSYRFDLNGNVSQRLEDGREAAATGAQLTAPRRTTLEYDQADWLQTQRDLGRDSACKGDQKFVTDYWDNGWEKQRDVYSASDACAAEDTGWEKKQTTTWDFFANGKLQKMMTINGSGRTLQSHDVGYISNGTYVNGHRTTDTFVLDRPNGTTCMPGSPCTATYVYDARDRLFEHRDGHGGTSSYKFDELTGLIGDQTIRAGNITTESTPEGTKTRTYQSNQLQTMTVGAATAKYWYDPLGNTDCVTLAAGTQAGCSPSDQDTANPNLVVDYTYDYLDRMSAFRSYAGGSKKDSTSYTYDALDRVVRESESHDEWQAADGQRATTFTYQGLTNLVTEEKQTNNTGTVSTKNYSYDAFGHRISMNVTEGGETDRYTFGYDVHGSVSQLVNESGAVKASYGYTPYGSADAELTKGDPADLDPLSAYRYTGKRMDSGMDRGAEAGGGRFGIDMGARRFGPDTARFLQQDMFHNAIGNLGLSLDPLTQNRYALAGGNPVSFVEFDGHMVMADGGGGSTTASGGSSTDEADGDGGSFEIDWLDIAFEVGGQVLQTLEDGFRDHSDAIAEGIQEFGDEADDFMDSVPGLRRIADDFENITDNVSDFVGRHGDEIATGIKFAGGALEILDAGLTFKGHIDSGADPLEAGVRTGIESGASIAAGVAVGGACLAVTAGIGSAGCVFLAAGAGYLGGRVGEAVGDWLYEGGAEEFVNSVGDVTSGALDVASDFAGGVGDAWNTLWGG